MYIDYSKLWKLLIDRDMTRTDLASLTGISSRVMAKLSKNETVTTDTIARICSELNCGVADIMECVSEQNISLYRRFLSFGETVDESETCKTVVFHDGSRKYKVYASKKSAAKNTHIHCDKNGTVYWEQLYILGGISSPQSERIVLVKPEREADEVTIVLIKGKPGVITGLDENGFVSASRQLKNDSDIYVMSQAAFKTFTIKE